jgi:hypothetical protein
MGTLKLERQSLVIDAEAAQHGGLNVVDVNRVRDDIIWEVVGLCENFRARRP